MSGFSDGTVIYARPTGKPLLLSELVQFRLPSEAQDVSIDDATGRFVAVLGKRAARIGLAGAPGYPVRIWDVSLPRFTFSVASGCLPNDKVVAIGDWWIANTDSGTVVTYVGDTDTTPLFQNALKTVRVEPAPATPDQSPTKAMGDLYRTLPDPAGAFKN